VSFWKTYDIIEMNLKERRWEDMDWIYVALEGIKCSVRPNKSLVSIK
jgi:hypothetical protein